MKFSHYKWFITIFVIIFSANAFGVNKVNNIRVWPSPWSTRVVLDLDENVKYNMFKLSSPDRVVLDVEGLDLSSSVTNSADIKNTPIESIRVGKRDKNITRIVFETNIKLEPNVFQLKPNEYYGYRLVLDLESSEKQKILSLFEMDEDTTSIHSAVASASSKSTTTARDFVIAIDCGHGGEDPGAIGPRGTKEKDVVLSIGKKLKGKIDKEPGMKAILTRGGDYYVGLRDRFERARLNHADIFISIHADAFHNKKAEGASVFILSERGATSEAAKWLADKENRADLVGGVRLDDKSDILASVLLDLSQTASKKASFDAAKMVLNSLDSITKLHKGHVEKAGFLVLKAPDLPSMLIETGFISNPKTEKKLRTSQYQDKLAEQILYGIKQYMDKYPHYIEKAHPETRKSYLFHVVKKGESLSVIASKYSVSIRDIKDLNNLASNNILVGQKLKVQNKKR